MKESDDMNLGIETETLEFKRSTGELKEAVHSICAILNKHQCGELYFGVKTDGTVIGQVVTEESLREVSQKIKNFIEPRIYPEISKVVLGGRDCIHVKFSGKQIPYFAYNVARIRVADEDLVMSREEITSFLLKTGDDGNRWENLTSNKTIEALVNSFCHKDYSSGESNEVAIYKDRIEIYNPGAFPEGLEPRDYIERAERPIRRNPKIARMLYYSKDIESFGTGLRRIANACDNAGVRYEFQKKKTRFVVCFYRYTNEKNEDKPIKADKKLIKADKK